LGTDFPYQDFLPGARTVQVDHDATRLGRRTPLELAVHGDVGATLRAVLPLVEPKDDRSFLDRMLHKHAKALEHAVSAYTHDVEHHLPIHPEYAVRILDELASQDAVFTVGTGMNNVWAARYVTPNGRRRVIGSFLHGSMANALPHAIGAQLAYPGRQVISMSGDGGLGMLLGELLTVSMYPVAVTTCSPRPQTRCAASLMSWTQTRTSWPNADASPATRSRVWSGACAAPSSARQVRLARWLRWRRFPASSTGFSRCSCRPPNGKRRSPPRRRARKRWRPRRMCSVRRPRHWRGVRHVRTSRAWTRRVMRWRAHSCTACPTWCPTRAPALWPSRWRRRSGSGRATYSARQVAGYALRAAGADVPDLDWPETEPEHQPARAVLRATEQRAREHGTVGSVWFQNSLRGAAGFAIGVYIAQRTGVQHGFWVVLGTLSVLRSNALGTGRSILSAVAGTAVGIVLGAVLVIVIGTHEGVLWVVLPVALFLAAYAPRAISFAVGQAGFTVFVLVLFNLLAPVGWRVGLVRAEDVAIGFAISLAVGVLFWPRGAAALIRQDLAIAYERAADYLAAAARQLIDGRTSEDATTARAAADVAVRRLDEAFRQYLGERSATPVNPEDIAALVSGASRVRRAAESLTALARMSNGEDRLDGCGRNLDRELGSLQTWYSAFGFALMSGGALPPPHVPDEEDARQLLSCVRDAAQSRGPATANAALALLLASQHLDNLSSLEALLSERANAIRTPPQDGGALRKLRVLAS
jgi:hypothetical protein